MGSISNHSLSEIDYCSLPPPDGLELELDME